MHGWKYKKSAKKVGAKLVLHAFAKLKGENRSAGAEQYTVGQIYNIWRLGGETTYIKLVRKMICISQVGVE